MKQSFILLTIIFLVTVNNFAQSYPNYTGVWQLDKEKSEIEKNLIELNEKLIVRHKGKSLRAKFAPKTEIVSEMDLGQKLQSTNRIHTYIIDGGTSSIRTSGRDGVISKSYSAVSEKKSVKLKWTRTSYTNEGDFIIKNEEIWTLSEDGKILTIKRKTEQNSEKINSILIYQKVTFALPEAEAKEISETMLDDMAPRRPNLPNLLPKRNRIP